MMLARDGEACGKSAACTSQEDLGERAICAAVVADIEHFFSTNHKHGIFSRAEQTHQAFGKAAAALDEEICGEAARSRCDVWSTKGKGAGCKHSCEADAAGGVWGGAWRATPRGLCIRMGVSCMEQARPSACHPPMNHPRTSP